MTAWRYIATRETGDGLGEIVTQDLPLADVTITTKLSGPPQITCSVPVEVSQLRDADSRPLLTEWANGVFAEDPNGGLYGAILVDSSFNGPKWELDCAGFSFYPKDQPWMWEDSWVQVDPLEIHRLIWSRLQSLLYGNLGVDVDVVSSPVRIGTAAEGTLPPKSQAAQAILDRMNSGQPYFEDWTWVGAPPAVSQYNDELYNEYNNQGDPKIFLQGYIAAHGPVVSFATGDGETVTFTAGPYTLNWFDTHDLGGEIDKLATDTPFDWVEEHYWDGDTIRHRIRVGYPRLGRRREDVRFAVGENVVVLPTVKRSGGDYASNVMFLGQGEGRDRVAGEIGNYTDRPRRVTVIDDKTITSKADAVEAARREQAFRNSAVTVTDLELIDHPNAPIGSVQLGDEVWLEGWTGWVDLAMWVRVVAISITPAKSDRIQLIVMRADVGV